MRIMGLDLGTRRIGVAVSDESATIAQGRENIGRKTDGLAVREILSLAEEMDVAEIVIGLPINMDGTEGARALDSRKFAEKLEKAGRFPVKFWDERMSTMEAESVMLEADISRRKRKKHIDKLAAQIILQGYLDCRANLESDKR